MKKLFVIILAALLCACASTQSASVDYKELTGYFVRNDVSGEVPSVITSQADFEKYFGYAAVMGENGLPTDIDWSKENVLTCVKPETDKQTDIRIIGVARDSNGALHLNTTVKEGEKMTYTIRPFVIVSVKKQ